MADTQKTPIDEYIEQQPAEIRQVLYALRQVIREVAPGALEKLGWGMPSFMLNGSLVQFAAHKNHVGFYPGPDAIETFKDELSSFKWAKGSIQFPYSSPVPHGLVRRIVAFRVAANAERAGTRRKR